MKNNNQQGQSLVALLIFVMVGMIITIAATFIVGINSLSTQKVEKGVGIRSLADSGAEEALINLIRNTNYTGGSLEVEGATVLIEVGGEGEVKTILSRAESGNFVKKVEVVCEFVNNNLRVVSWKEVI